MKRERWGSPLVQEKYREEKAFDKRHPYRIIIIIIIVIYFLRTGTNAIGPSTGIAQAQHRDNTGTAQGHKRNTQMANNKRKHLQREIISSHF